MWRWPWIPISAASAALIAQLCLPAAPGLPAARADALSPTSSGPASPKEAEILWNDGKAGYQAGRFEDAADRLQRLVDRYPGYPGYLDAHLMLGRARIELGKDAEALAPLRYYVGAAGHNPKAAEARLWLSRALLRLERFNEAYLTTVEVENLHLKSREQLLAAALILRAQALIGLDHDPRALRALDSADKLLASKASTGAAPPFSQTALRGEAAWTRLHLQDRACARFPSKGPLDEGQVRDQLERRGNCLLQSLLNFRNTLAAGDPQYADRASQEIAGALHDYAQACSNPPDPPKLKPKNRTALQLKRYHDELTTLLERDCASKFSQAADLAGSWGTDVPPSMTGYVTALSRNLGKLSKAEK